MRRLAFALLLTAGPAFAGVVDHDIAVTVDPAGHRIAVRDTVTLPAPTLPARGGSHAFILHAGLQPRLHTKGARLQRDDSILKDMAIAVPAEGWRLWLPPRLRSATLDYGGVIHHPPATAGGDAARGVQGSPGIVGEEGVVLSGASLWLPTFGDDLVTLRMKTTLPAGWTALSQGRETADGWEERQPQEEAYLVAGRYTITRGSVGATATLALLRQPDPALAQRYLDATAAVLPFYERMLGRYPYAKFALVENFWETGFGMPSFTLLGSSVIRLPFIATTSYPHEILHNWWGNGVYVDGRDGNWSEGLTAYLADHLAEERSGRGADYRREALQKYADYVGRGAARGRDIPLTAFRMRHSPASEAVGYGKALMLFHMLRRRLGEEAFTAALRAFYRDNLFRPAAWADLEKAFSQASGSDLAAEFAQWVRRPGAPALRLSDAAVAEEDGGFRLTARVEQVQAAEPFRLTVPMAVTVEGAPEAVMAAVPLEGRSAELSLWLPARPLRLDVDPAFDLFRLLDPGEMPVALSAAFGATRPLFVLPSAAPPPLLEAYGAMAAGWSPGADIRLDRDIDALPPGRSIWLLGWENRFRPDLAAALLPFGAMLDDDGASLPETKVRRSSDALALAVPRPGADGHALAFAAAADPAALPGLGRKLPHYHKYGWVAFTGAEPTNTARGRWSTAASPLSALFVAIAPAAALPRRPVWGED